jgi:hypothetical protein
VTWARDERPHALVAIDFPDFNFPLARRVRKLGIRVVYYVGPQIWAWRPGRLKTMRSVADRVLVIFPFEEAIYQRGGVPVEFVGHPLVDLAKPSAPRDAFLRGLGLAPQAPTVAICRAGQRGRQFSGSSAYRSSAVTSAWGDRAPSGRHHLMDEARDLSPAVVVETRTRSWRRPTLR